MSRGGYYSPRIKWDLIPILYRLAKAEKKPMTTLVDQVLRDDLFIRGLIDHDQASFTGRGIKGFPGNLRDQDQPQPRKEDYHEGDHHL